jgi:IS30 family transposase
MKRHSKLEKSILEKKVIQMYVMHKIGGTRIGNELGISSTEVYRILKRNNIDRRKRESLVAQKIIKLFENNISIAEISQQFGLQEKTIEIIISQRNIK